MIIHRMTMLTENDSSEHLLAKIFSMYFFYNKNQKHRYIFHLTFVHIKIYTLRIKSIKLDPAVWLHVMMVKRGLNESFATVSMFTHSAIASLNNLEMMVYNYVIKNRDKVMYMTIRELADAAGVSTTTILRFCRKLNCEGYSEFRVRFKLYLEQNEPQQANFGASEIISFFKSVNNEEFDALLDDAVNIILSSERIIFVGAGTSGSLAKYGARFFSNIGKFSNHIDDPYFPVTNDMAKNALAIVLSVSGETEEILRFASQFSLHHCKVLSITSHEHSRLAKLADFNLSWHVPQTRIAGVYDITTQIPVIYILESLGRKLAKKLAE
ncbi:hypothetical protein AE42_00948 [Enterobacter kobei]|nr:hypothetical protein AE42_00948 [Enterobacter kobei]